MKLCKKLLSTFLAVIMIFSSFAVISVAAGDSLNAATSLTLGSSYSGSVTSSSASEFYKFSLSTSGRININLTANIKYLSFFVYDANGNEVWNYYSYYWNNTTQQLSFIKDIDLKAGTYYFAIKKSGDNYGNYNLKISFTSANESYSENLTNTNNTLPTASQLTLNTSKKGQIAQNDNSDIYKFTITESGRVNLDFVGNIAYLSFFVYDSNNNVIWQYYSLAWNSTTKQLTLNKNYDLTAGTYYLAFQKSGDNTGNYTFTTQFTSANESYPENLTNSNNTLPTASQLTLNTTKKGQIALNDNNDIYKFTITESGRVNLDFVGNIAYLSFFIYDIDNNVLWQYYSLAWNSTTEQLTLNKNYDLSAGTYYLAFQKSGDNTGNYTFTTQFTSANESFKENESKTDNTINSANSISLNKQYLGNIGMNDERDFFKFSVQSTGKQKITVNANIKYLSFFVYDASGNEVWNYYSYSWNSTTQQLTFQKEIDFKSTGTYYFAIARSGDNTGQYNFNIGNGTVSQQYTVTYNANGGSVSPSSASVTAGNSTTLPTPTRYATITYDANGGTGAPSPTKAYFNCLGWATSSSATSASYACGTSYKPTSSTTLYAVWESKAYTNLSTVTPTRSGYKFLGWALTADATEPKFTPNHRVQLGADDIVYAVWEKDSSVPKVEYKTIFLNYKDTYSINVDGYIAYDYISDNHSIVTVDSEGTVRANGVGSTDVYVYDSDYNVIAVYTFDVEYSWWQWILIIVLFGWIWY